MRQALRLGLAAQVAALALLAMVAGASANRLSSSSQTFRIVWRAASVETTSGSGRLSCPVTLEGSLHSATIAKTVGALIGYVTRASVNGSETSCTGGTATVLTATLPWHVQYQGFTGTLPSISGGVVSVLGVSVQVHFNGSLTCLGRSEARNPLRGIAVIEAGGTVTGVKPESGATIPLTGEGGLCAFTRAVLLEEGVGVESVLGTTTSIRVTLI